MTIDQSGLSEPKGPFPRCLPKLKLLIFFSCCSLFLYLILFSSSLCAFLPLRSAFLAWTSWHQMKGWDLITYNCNIWNPQRFSFVHTQYLCSCTCSALSILLDVFHCTVTKLPLCQYFMSTSEGKKVISAWEGSFSPVEMFSAVKDLGLEIGLIVFFWCSWSFLDEMSSISKLQGAILCAAWIRMSDVHVISFSFFLT